MTIDEIAKAIAAGEVVCWRNTGYRVVASATAPWGFGAICKYNDSYAPLVTRELTDCFIEKKG